MGLRWLNGVEISIAQLAWLVWGLAHVGHAMEPVKLGRDANVQCAPPAMVQGDAERVAAEARFYD